MSQNAGSATATEETMASRPPILPPQNTLSIANQGLERASLVLGELAASMDSSLSDLLNRQLHHVNYSKNLVAGVIARLGREETKDVVKEVSLSSTVSNKLMSLAGKLAKFKNSPTMPKTAKASILSITGQLESLANELK